MARGVEDLRTGYRTGTITPTQAVDDCLKAIDALEANIGAWVAVYADDAREAAKRATEELTRRLAEGTEDELGDFFGIPYALKDIVDVEGHVTTGGCAERKEHVATETATIAKRLEGAGGILIGKVKTVEFAMGAWYDSRSEIDIGNDGTTESLDLRCTLCTPQPPSLMARFA